MKRFLKFVVTIVVILVITFTIYFLMKNMSRYETKHNNDTTLQSGNSQENYEIENLEKNEENNVQNGNKIIDDVKSQEPSGEIVSSDNNFTKDLDSKIKTIKNIENQNESAIPTDTIEDNLGIDILGTDFQSFFQAFQIEEAAVTVQIAGSMVYILPTSDFLDNMQFHYDKNGNLVLYVREFAGIGGETKYYFEFEKLITINMDIESESQMQYENVDEILQRARLVYDRYIKK